MLKTGIKGIKKAVVGEENTASGLLSGLLPVYATPALAALMEYTCSDSVQSELEPGTSTVGTALDIKHLSASPVGAHITCQSELIELDGRRLVFRVEASDDFGPIGEGRHERFIINEQKFMNKVNLKQAELAKAPSKD